MDSLLHKFSLQNLLRQFFCGVVFFVPLWLFWLDAGCECCSCLLMDITKWETGAFLLFASFASVIGTIIYHVEKNLYSYSTQLVFEMLAKKVDSTASRILVCVVLSLFCLVCLIGFGVIYLLLLIPCAFIALAILTNGKRVVERTQQCWIIERYPMSGNAEKNTFKKDELVSFMQSRCIAEKLSTWSDFIHCVQSCCFSWVVGCIFCTSSSFRVLTANSCAKKNELLDMDILISDSLYIVVTILLLLFLFDWHRYQHIIAMTEGSFSIPSTFPNRTR